MANRATMKQHNSLVRSGPQCIVAIVSLAMSLLPGTGRCQISPNQANQIRTGIENRIEALTILGGDFGFADGSFKSRGKLQPGQASTQVQSDVT
jgi:hypothetical protein